MTTCVKCGHERRFSDREDGTCEARIVLEQAELGVESTICGCFCEFPVEHEAQPAITNPVKLLSDDALRDIEAAQVKRRESLAFHQTEYPGLPSPPYIEEIDALCTTVRALRAELESSDGVGLVLLEAGREVGNELQRVKTENTALREQLAQSEQEWKAFENLGKRIETDLRARLAQVTQEREGLRKQIEKFDAIVTAYENQDQEALEEAENL